MKDRQKKMILLFILLLILGGCTKGSAEPEASSDPEYTAEGIRKVSVVREQQEVLQISYQPQSYEESFEYWNITVPYGDWAIVDTETMLLFYGQLEGLDFKQYLEAAEESETGIENSNNQILVEYCQDSSLEADSFYRLLIGNYDGQDSYYAAFESEPEKVFLLPREKVDSILDVTPFDLVLKVVAAVPLDTVAAVEISWDDEVFEMAQTEQKYFFDKEQIEEKEYRSLYSELFSILTVGEAQVSQLNDQELLLGMNFVRSVDEAEDLEIKFYSYEESCASVRINGIERLLVAKEDIEELKNKIGNRR